MSRVTRITSHFTGGEVAPEVFGRVDLRLWNTGAARLRNVFVRPTGGVTRRPGLRWLDDLPTTFQPTKSQLGGSHSGGSLSYTPRLVAFTPRSDHTYLLVFVPQAVWVGRVVSGSGSEIQPPKIRPEIRPEIQWVARVTSPWQAAHLPSLNWCPHASQLLVVHPDVPPQCIRFQGIRFQGIRFQGIRFQGVRPQGVRRETQQDTKTGVNTGAHTGTWTITPWVWARSPSGAPEMPFDRTPNQVGDRGAIGR